MALDDINGLKRASLREALQGVASPARLPLTRSHSLTAPLFDYAVHRDFSDCETEWRNFEKTALATPFQSFDWLNIWWQAYRIKEQNQTLELNLIFAYREGALALILPLIVEPFKNVRRLSWLCCHLSDYNVPVISRAELAGLNRETIDHLWSDILGLVPSVDILYLPKQPRQVAGRPNPFYTYRASDYHLAYHSAAIMGDWQAYYTGRRKSKSRSRLKSKENFMRQKASMTINEVYDPALRSQIVSKTIRWKRNQVAAGGAIDPFSNVETDHFFGTLASSPALAASFRVFSLNVAGEPIACAFGLNAGDNFVLYQTAYKVGEYVRYSPGVLLLLHMMEKMADEGRCIFDFSIGDEPYKFDWATRHDRLSVSIRTNSLKGWLAKITILAKLNMKGWIKSSKRRFELVKTMRRFWHNRRCL